MLGGHDDGRRFFPIPGRSGANGTPPSAVLGSNFLPDSELNQIGATEDDISLLWLKPGTSTTDAVVLRSTTRASYCWFPTRRSTSAP
jgi:hypothetical protein